MTLQQLLQQLVTEDGAIVTSNQCSEIEIADAAANGRFAVDEEGIGYVRRYKEWLDKHRKCDGAIRNAIAFHAARNLGDPSRELLTQLEESLKP